MSADASREERLQAVLLPYLQAVDAGQEPDREELLRRHPDLADELRAFFADQKQIEKAVNPLRHIIPDAEAQTLPPDEPKPADSSLGKVRYFGDYELLEEIARGGMSVVYKARQVSLNRLVALKMILAGQLASPAEVQRFRTEAEAAANLDHPNIVAIHEVGEHQGQHYFSMAYVDGGSLADRLSGNPLPTREAAELVQTVAQAIQFAHERGVIHRDLKPANILLDAAGQPKVSDFGLAKRFQSGDRLTVTGEVLGTPSYMAPEQAAGKVNLVGPLADVYALGAVLNALLTGRPPFQASTPLDILIQVMEQDPPRPSRLTSNVPRELETICLKCLEKVPARRYESARELADDLGRFLRHEPIRAKPASLVRRVWAWSRRRPWVLTAAASLLVVALSCLAYGTWAQLREARWNVLYLEAKVGRLAGKPETALERLHQAAAIWPDPQLSDEALMVSLGQGRAARRIDLTPTAEQALSTLRSPALEGGQWFPQGGQYFPFQVFEFSQDGRVLLCGNGGNAVVIDTTTGKVVLHLTDVLATLDPNGKLLACESHDERDLMMQRGKTHVSLGPRYRENEDGPCSGGWCGEAGLFLEWQVPSRGY